MRQTARLPSTLHSLYYVRTDGFYLLLSGGDEGTYLEAGGAWP